MIEIRLANHWDSTKSDDHFEMSVYHSLEWRKTISVGFGGKWVFIIAAIKGDDVAVIPLLFKKYNLLECLGSPLRGTFSLYMGPGFKKHLSKGMKGSILKEIVSFLGRLKYDLIEIVVAAETINLNDMSDCLEKNGFSISTVPSLEVDLSVGKQAVWEKMEGRARTAIRKAEKNRVSIESKLFNIHESNNLYIMLSETFKRQGAELPHSNKSYTAFAENLHHKSQYIYAVARHEDKTIACGLYLIDGKRLVFHTGANSEKGYILGASSLLKWDIFQRAIDMNLASFDFGGVGIGSIDKFKSSFGSQPILHHRLSRISKRFFLIEKIMSNKVCKKIIIKIMRRLKTI